MICPWLINPFFIHLINWKFKKSYQEARFEKDSRYYVLRLEKDLLDDWTIVLINGRIQSKLGQSRIIAFEHYSEAFEQFCLRAKTRYTRGYTLLFWKCDDVLFRALLLHLAVNKTFTKPSKESKKKQQPRLTLKTPIIHSLLTVSQQKTLLF